MKTIRFFLCCAVMASIATAVLTPIAMLMFTALDWLMQTRCRWCGRYLPDEDKEEGLDMCKEHTR